MLKARRDREEPLRRGAVVVHRWAGIALAGFLIVTGLTGSVIAFHHELDRWLNPGVLTVEPAGPWLPVEAWVEAVEREIPAARVVFVTVPRARDEPAVLFLEPRWDREAGAPRPLAVDQAFVQPATGAVLGARDRDGFRLDRLHAIPFVYTLHYSMHLGGWGMWLLGGVAILWFFDSFVGLYLAWPRRTWRALRRMLTVRWHGGPTRVNYDLHRAGGVWFWAVLLTLAFTGMSMNLHDEVFEPLVEAVSPMTPFPGEHTVVAPGPAPPPALSVTGAIALGTRGLRESGRRGELGAVWIEPAKDLYHLGFHTTEDLMREHPGTWVSVSASQASVVGVRPAGGFTLGDAIHDWQFPLHSGKAFGLAGRIAISVSGLAVVVLTVTGLTIWLRKRSVRRAFRKRGRVGRSVPAAVACSEPELTGRLPFALRKVNRAESPRDDASSSCGAAIGGAAGAARGNLPE